MFIYIDESGSFVPSHSANSWNVVAAYVTPEATRKHAESALRKLKLSAGKSHSDEIKLRELSENQLSEFLARIGELDSLFFASCIDLGLQRSDTIHQHQTIQVEKIRVNIHRMIYPEGRALIEDLAGRVANLSAQLYVQMVTQIDLLDQVHRQTTLYYSQRTPATLGSFRWRIDEKNRRRPNFEETLHYLSLPLLHSKSQRDPLTFVHGFDYSHYEKNFQPHPKEMPSHLHHSADIKTTPRSNLGKVLSDIKFVKSHNVAGVQIADLLSSTLRRLMRSGFQNNELIAQSIGRIMVQREKYQPPAHLISLSENQHVSGYALDILEIMKNTARAMFKHS